MPTTTFGPHIIFINLISRKLQYACKAQWSDEQLAQWDDYWLEEPVVVKTEREREKDGKGDKGQG